MSDPKSLLPPNRSRVERELEAVTVRSTQVEAPFNDLWDPWACPASVLPWLAWALGVQEWSASWPESRRRGVVAAAMGIRRRAGTAAAVREAVESLEIEGIEYAEWHEYDGEPGTYRITATLEERGMDQAQYAELVRVIERAGRLSAWLDPVGFTLVGRGRFRAACATTHGQVTTVRPRLVTQVVQAHPGVSGTGMQTRLAVDVRPALVVEVAQQHVGRSGWGLHAAAWTTVFPG
ncbi:Bacteriophage P2-related tail formation protein-like protein [Thioalkalivibrio sulfidiphilus HL-EbGr7]|uniref:Bacteriophage P2-related tail formation protein-like protein n=1 Tax=Thioalkalivibrio sulfidiphilus (strain HL-EbGR7) TaxID=396588 RepID=B8GRZ9_THISH|nr:phage tail protein I [Thioalkalivibrio sulfidiphilus]ACL72703.1 Bacteriophage P2-related tail formation protein-like protein [Thioalkalivibrio sulfidiphilus HL-EbGr7]